MSIGEGGGSIQNGAALSYSPAEVGAIVGGALTSAATAGAMVSRAVGSFFDPESLAHRKMKTVEGACWWMAGKTGIVTGLAVTALALDDANKYALGGGLLSLGLGAEAMAGRCETEKVILDHVIIRGLGSVWDRVITNVGTHIVYNKEVVLNLDESGQLWKGLLSDGTKRYFGHPDEVDYALQNRHISRDWDDQAKCPHGAVSSGSNVTYNAAAAAPVAIV